MLPKSSFLHTLVAGLALALAAFAVNATPFAYITNFAGDSVSVIDTATNTVVATIAVGDGPRGVAVNSAGTLVYVVNDNISTISVIDPATFTVVATVPLFGFRRGIALTPDGTRAYVANFGTDAVDVVNTATNTVLTNVAVGSNPVGIAVNPAGTRVYVANTSSSSVSVIDTATNTVTANVVLTDSPTTLAINPAGTRVYVASGLANNFVVINTATNAVVNTVAVTGLPRGIAFNPAGTRAYVANITTDTVSVIDTATETVLTTIAVGDTPYGVAFNPAGTRAYVANIVSGTVSVIDTASSTVIATVTAGAQPTAFGLFVGGPATTVPGAPAIGTATSGNAQATVAFTAPTYTGGSAITGYTVTSAPAGGVDSNAGNAGTSHVMTGLTNGTAYTFSVRATNGVGNSQVSAASNSVTPLGPPSPPTGASATAGNALAVVNFTPSASNGGSAITGYTVTSNPPGGVDSDAGSTFNSHLVTGLTNGTAYTFTVTATNAVGSTPSTASNSVTPATVPGAPTGVAATGGNAQATVTFATPASNGGSTITGYTVTSIPAGGVDGNAGTPGLSHVITGLANGTAYTFTVTATNGVGPGSPSVASNSVTPATVPGAPQIGTATPGNGQAVIAFTAPLSDGGNAILSYTATCNPGAVSATGTIPSITVTGLANGTPYLCSVAATNGVGPGAASATANVTPANRTFTGPTMTGTGTATVSFTGGGAGCTFAPPGNGPLQSAFFIPLTGHPKSPPAGSAPPGVNFTQGLLDFVLLSCTPASSVTLTVTYPNIIDRAQYWKYGPTPDNAAGHWYILPATIAGDTATLTITDGGLGDDDLAANGSIVDQGGPGFPPPAPQVPTLSAWAKIVLVMMLGVFGFTQARRRTV